MLNVVLVEPQCSRCWFAPSGLLNTDLSICVEPQYGDYGVTLTMISQEFCSEAKHQKHKYLYLCTYRTQELNSISVSPP